MAGLPGNYKEQQYMFWLAPMCGAAVAAFIYEYGSLKPQPLLEGYVAIKEASADEKV
eukprot:CAMPEP_0184972484 /NCGR_PEP_ID=MMETSP1098-20130426/4474_1 /TAXON_ID=89044 /ORGANISM="Spumella elongata, Strain CCAP 955/1" /LENGTH=56 /DNA_ID=CAMNT_0027494779 /DNA_START=27 /DNA_END=197 /DNA_ORIENTATION=-